MADHWPGWALVMRGQVLSVGSALFLFVLLRSWPIWRAATKQTCSGVVSWSRSWRSSWRPRFISWVWAHRVGAGGKKGGSHEESTDCFMQRLLIGFHGEQIVC